MQAPIYMHINANIHEHMHIRLPIHITCVCVNTYMHIHLFAHAYHVSVDMYIYICMYVCMHVCLLVCTMYEIICCPCADMRICNIQLYTSVYAYVNCTYARAYSCMSIHIYVCRYVIISVSK